MKASTHRCTPIRSAASRALLQALAAWALALPLLALLAPAAEANSPGCSRADGNYQAHEDWALTPSNLNNGDKFRLLFASSTTRNARATINVEYDTFIENRAKAGHSAITDGCAGKFTSLISTSGWSANQNTATRGIDTDASIWWLDGRKVADDYADFYDGSWDSRNHKNEYGTTTSYDRVWTGSLTNGNVHPTQYAGVSGNVRLARLGSGNPLGSDARSSAQTHRVFGLSPIFSVVKDPRLSVQVAKTSANETNTGNHYVGVTVTLDKARSTKTTFKLCVKNTSTATFRTSTSTKTRDFDLYEHAQEKPLTVDSSNCRAMEIGASTRPGARKQLRIRIYGDNEKELHETVVLELRSPSSNVKIGTATATHTITNDDSDPTVTIAAGATASEGTNATFTVKSSHAPAQALSVKVNITEAEDDTTGKNHVAAADEGVRTVTVAAGSTSQSFTVPTSEDWVDEPDGVITATVQAGTGYVVGSARSAQVNVEDDDTRGLEFSPASLKIKEEGTATYTVRLKSQPIDVGESVTVTLTPLGDLSVDTDSKMAGNQTTLQFNAVGGKPWQDGQTVTVTAGEDADSTDDTDHINHEASGADYGAPPGKDFGVLRGITVTVTDIDVPHLVVAPTALSVTEGSSSTFTVKLATQPSVDGTLTFASNNSDVTFSPTSLGYLTTNHQTRGWNRLRTVTVHAASDNDIGDDTATLTVTASGGDYQGKTATVAATVTDTTTPELVLSTSTLSVMEDASTTYTVALAAKPTGRVTVAIGSNNGDVMVDTDTGTDGNQNRLTFQPSGSPLWSDPQTVTVNARGDADTANEAVKLTHTASGGGYDTVRKTLSGTVTDDGKKTVGFSRVRYPVIEGKGPVTITLVLSEARTSTTNVRVSATPLTATGNGVDYTGQTFTATFSAGSYERDHRHPHHGGQHSRENERRGVPHRHARLRLSQRPEGGRGSLICRYLRRGGRVLHEAANDDGRRRRAPARVHPERASAVLRRRPMGATASPMYGCRGGQARTTTTASSTGTPGSDGPRSTQIHRNPGGRRRARAYASPRARTDGRKDERDGNPHAARAPEGLPRRGATVLPRRHPPHGDLHRGRPRDGRTARRVNRASRPGHIDGRLSGKPHLAGDLRRGGARRRCERFHADRHQRDARRGEGRGHACVRRHRLGREPRTHHRRTGRTRLGTRQRHHRRQRQRVHTLGRIHEHVLGPRRHQADRRHCPTVTVAEHTAGSRRDGGRNERELHSGRRVPTPSVQT